MVLPPSRSNWGEYSVLIDRPIAPLPRWVVDLATSLTVHEGGGEGATESRFDLPETIREGTRAKTLYGYGCSLRAHGHDHAAILAELRRVNAKRCVPPLGDAEVRKIACSAARHEKGNAAPAVTPETLEALEGVWAAVEAAPWKGMGGGSERDVMVALVKAARLHGTLIPAGVRVSLDYRSLALAASISVSSAHRAVQRLRKKGWLRYDNLGRKLSDSGALVLVGRAHPLRTPEHSTTSSRASENCSSSRDTELVNVPPCAPRLRWGRSLGKRCGAVVDTLEATGRRMTVKEVAAALHVKKTSDVRRRYVARLVEAGVVEYDEADDTVGLRRGWRRALEEERLRSGEKKREEDDRRVYDGDRQNFRRFLADQSSGGQGGETA